MQPNANRPAYLVIYSPEGEESTQSLFVGTPLLEARKRAFALTEVQCDQLNEQDRDGNVEVYLVEVDAANNPVRFITRVFQRLIKEHASFMARHRPEIGNLPERDYSLTALQTDLRDLAQEVQYYIDQQYIISLGAFFLDLTRENELAILYQGYVHFDALGYAYGLLCRYNTYWLPAGQNGLIYSPLRHSLAEAFQDGTYLVA